MAEDKKESPKPLVNDLGWFLGILFILWILWFMTGGVQRYDSNKPFVKPLAPNQPVETYGQTQN